MLRKTLILGWIAGVGFATLSLCVKLDRKFKAAEKLRESEQVIIWTEQPLADSFLRFSPMTEGFESPKEQRKNRHATKKIWREVRRAMRKEYKRKVRELSI